MNFKVHCWMVIGAEIVANRDFNKCCYIQLGDEIKMPVTDMDIHGWFMNGLLKMSRSDDKAWYYVLSPS